MRRATLLSLLLACGCSPPPSADGDAAAVYKAFLDADHDDYSNRVILQSLEIPVTARTFADMETRVAPGISQVWSVEVREAVQDLVDRGRTPRPLPAEIEVWHTQVRISPDSVTVLFEQIRVHDLRRLPDSSSIVQFSAVGFSRGRTVAVVWQNVVCGSLCGGGIAQVVRKHPGGWIAAEVLFAVIY